MTLTENSATTGSGQYADVNGLHLYYEIHGSGKPLVLLHGGLGSGEMFGPTLPALAASHQVILPDLQGHGRTADIDRPIDMRLMADDIAALIRQLGHERVDVMGYSLGGGVAFWTAVKHPELVGKLILRLGPHPAGRDLSRDARAAGARSGPEARRVPQGHADVPAYYAGRATAGGLRAAARQDRRRRWPRTSTSPTRSAASRSRR